jgi:hypothetical protein
MVRLRRGSKYLWLPKTLSRSDGGCGGVLFELAMVAFLTWLVLVLRALLKTRARLEAEHLALRRQVIVLSRKSPACVRLRNRDR